MKTAETFIRFDEYRNVVSHETTDSEVIIVECEAHGAVVVTGSPFEQKVIAVLRVRDRSSPVVPRLHQPLPLVEAMATVTAAQQG